MERVEGRQSLHQNAPLVLTNGTDDVSVPPHVVFSAGAFGGPQDALRQRARFVPFTEADFSALPDTASLWFALSLQRAADAPAAWVLSSKWYHTRAYLYEGDSLRYIGQTGLVLPLAERQVANYITLPNFTLELPPSQPVELLLEVRHDIRSYGSNDDDWASTMRLCTASRWQAQWERRELISLVYLGAMLALGLYHLLLFLSLRNVGYLWFAGVVTLWGLCWSDTAGVVSSIFYPAHLPFHLSIWFHLLVASIAIVHGFSAVLLDLKRTAPVFHRLLVGLIWMYVPIVIFALAQQWDVAVWGAAAWALCGLLVQLAMSIALALRRHPLGKVYLSAIAFALLGGFVYIFTWLGWLPRNDFTVHAFVFGSLGQSLFFSLALATRIKLIKEGQQQALMDEAQARQRLESLREQDALKSELIGLASHDLKNPLHNILGFAELLQQHIPSSDETQRVPLYSIQRSAERMLEILDALLQTSAIDQGRLTLNTQLVDLGALARETLAAHRTHAEAKQQRLDFDSTGGQRDYHVLGDPVYLRSVLDNLTSNAIKYADAGATTTVSLIRMNGTVHLDVKDEGPGLSQEDQQRLFQPFQRLSPRPTGGETSTGVGLMAAKRLVELHGGEIRVRSMLGKGSTFTVILPHAESDQVPEPSAAPSP
ncbi:MAG: sensor histidine kinase [Bacteroidota bacterium]